MITKTQFVPIIICITCIFSIQFISCKKDNSTLNKPGSVIIDNGASNSLSNTLVAWYTFNGDALDHSSHGNNVTFNSATPTKGRGGLPNTAYLFDGATSYMTVNNSSSLNPLQQITLAAMIKPTGFYQGLCHRNTILYKANDDNTPGKYLLAFDDMAYYNFNGCSEQVQNQFQNFYGSYGDGQATAAGARDSKRYIEANKWYVVVFTYDGFYAKLYINGTLRTTNAVSTTFTPNTVPLYIGRGPGSQFPYWFTGVIDEIKIYNTALSATNVQQLNQALQSGK